MFLSKHCCSFLKNAFTVIFWFLFKKKDAKVVYFNVPSSVLYSFLDIDVSKTLSKRLNEIYQYKLFNLSVDEILNNDQYDNNAKKVAKISWIISSLRLNGLDNPVQLLQSANGKYICHPGTDRAIILTYIDPVETITGFYIWYEDLDPTPFVLDYKYTIISNPFTFLKKFRYNKNFNFKTILMHNDLDVSDKVNGNAIFKTSKDCFLKVNNYSFHKNFLTYYDSTQWQEIKKVNTLSDLVQFTSDNECNISGVSFKKINNEWVPQYNIN